MSENHDDVRWATFRDEPPTITVTNLSDKPQAFTVELRVGCRAPIRITRWWRAWWWCWAVRWRLRAAWRRGCSRLWRWLGLEVDS